MSDETRDWWNETAEYFQDEGDIDIGIDYGWGYIGEPELGFIPESVEGLKVLEIGCGAAQCGIDFAQQGADVTGVDLSEKQLEYAQSWADDRGVDIQLVQGDIAELPIEGENKFDIVFSSYALQWLEDLEQVFTEAFRVLKSEGLFVFSLPHPFYKIFDPDTKEIKTSYFNLDKRVENEDGIDSKLVVYHHSIADIFSALGTAEFHVTDVAEPGFDDPSEYPEKLWTFNPVLASDVPPTLVVRARKP